MAMAWPARIKDKGGIRHQFHHVIDIVPTILEAAGLPQPVMVNGVAQRPIEGVSMAYTWDDANAPGRRDDAVLRDVRVPRHLPRRLDRLGAAHPGALGSHLDKPPADVMNGFTWELYNLNEDWTQADDLAAKMPDKLRDMQQLFTLEADEVPRLPARRHAPQQVHLAESRTTRPAGPSSPIRARSPTCRSRATGGAPTLLNRSYTITAEVEIPQGGAEGMLVTDGGRFAGYGFYLLKGRPVFTWNLVGLERVKWQGKEALAPGKHTLEFDWKYDGPGLGKGGTGTLKVDGEVVDSHPMPRSLPHRPAVGRDLQRRPRHRHAGGRPGLPGAVPLHRQDRQADGEARAGRAFARSQEEGRHGLPGQAVGTQPPR